MKALDEGEVKTRLNISIGANLHYESNCRFALVLFLILVSATLYASPSYDQNGMNSIMNFCGKISAVNC